MLKLSSKGFMKFWVHIDALRLADDLQRLSWQEAAEEYNELTFEERASFEE